MSDSSERFKRKIDSIPLATAISDLIAKANESKKKIQETDVLYKQLDPGDQHVVDEMVIGTTDGIRHTTHVEWILAANDEGINPDTILRMLNKVNHEPADPNADLLTKVFPPKVH